MLDYGSNYGNGSTFIPQFDESAPKPNIKYANTANSTSERKAQSQPRSEALPAQPVRRHNCLFAFEFVSQDTRRPAKLSTIEPLRVVVEEYKTDEGREFIAFWALNKTFVGHGKAVDDAIHGLAENVLHDYLFYSSKKARELTTDAQAAKKLLTMYLAMEK